MADKLVGKILAVLENVESTPRQFGVGFEHIEPRRIRDHLFDERFETLAGQ